MKTNITTSLLNALKVSVLAVVLSLGFSYALAWTAPATIPPTGNVSAPINTSATTQVKAGDFTARFLSANSITFPDSTTQTTAASIPSGAVMYFKLASCPSGWLSANGANGTPDLRGEFIRGLDSGRGVDTGRALGSAQTQDIQSHTHSYVSWTQDRGYAGTGLGFPNGAGITGATGGPETRPRNVALLACIKS